MLAKQKQKILFRNNKEFQFSVLFWLLHRTLKVPMESLTLKMILLGFQARFGYGIEQSFKAHKSYS